MLGASISKEKVKSLTVVTKENLDLKNHAKLTTMSVSNENEK